MIGDDSHITTGKSDSLRSQSKLAQARSNISIDEKFDEADLYKLEGMYANTQDTYANPQDTYANTQDTYASLQQIPESASEESTRSLKNKQNSQNRDVEMASKTGGYSNQTRGSPPLQAKAMLHNAMLHNETSSSLAEGKGFPNKSSNYMSSMYDVALDL